MMTQETFWRLFESKEIAYKIFTYENPNAEDGEVSSGEVITFEYQGKFYLRICESHKPVGYRKRYKNGGWDWAKIKEFDSKEHANAYFKKAFGKYTRFA